MVWVPQVGGVIRAPRAPPKRWRLTSSSGSWGFSVKRVVSWPVCGSGSTSPASLATIAGLFVFDHQVDREQRAEGVVEGLGEVDGAVQRFEASASPSGSFFDFVFGVACCTSSGEVTSTVPILAASGQLWGAWRSDGRLLARPREADLRARCRRRGRRPGRG